jgi:DNA helicase-2/ATP-dependent DNA helicase PcrA
LNDFDELLGEWQLSDIDLERYSKRGASALTTFLGERYDAFDPQQISERDFSAEGIVFTGAHLTGKIDLIDIDEDNKTITVTDYKTGKPSHSWKGRTEYERVKLHHYEQQLMFYKLLIENSRSYRGYTVESGCIQFVEPDEQGKIIRLEYTYDTEKLDQFKQLFCGVWDSIVSLKFEPTNTYPATLAGIVEFEGDIIDSFSSK